MSDALARWRFQEVRTDQTPRWVSVEGSAVPPEGGENVAFFLLIGGDYATADVRPLRREAHAFIEGLCGVLGPPATGPTPLNIGELMDSDDEVPVNAFWQVPETDRDRMVGALLHILQEPIARTLESGGGAHG